MSPPQVSLDCMQWPVLSGTYDKLMRRPLAGVINLFANEPTRLRQPKLQHMIVAGARVTCGAKSDNHL